jgi:hypothetical protein
MGDEGNRDSAGSGTRNPTGLERSRRGRRGRSIRMGREGRSAGFFERTEAL